MELHFVWFYFEMAISIKEISQSIVYLLILFGSVHDFCIAVCVDHTTLITYEPVL
jgi:hypothetical protein